MKIFASIITYNPDIIRLSCLIESLISQVDKLIIVDNCSTNAGQIEDILVQYRQLYVNKITVKYNEKNKGIAYALNQSLYYCNRHNCNWLLTMDQDSIVPKGFINRYIPYCKESVGQLCCNFVNKNTPDLKVEKMSPLTIPVGVKEAEKYNVYACITSGSLNNVNACLKVGGFLSKLFIDYVDYDISLKLFQNGYDNILINDNFIEHNFGDAVDKRFFLLKYTDYNFSPKRLFYKSRNAIYMINHYPSYKYYFIKAILYDIFCCLVNFRIKHLSSCLNGIFVGMKKYLTA